MKNRYPPRPRRLESDDLSKYQPSLREASADAVSHHRNPVVRFLVRLWVYGFTLFLLGVLACLLDLPFVLIGKLWDYLSTHLFGR